MSLLDVTGYDLTTSDGQNAALQDIIDEQNRQYDQSAAASSYTIVAYAQLIVDLIDGSPSGIYTATYVHGLGYPPAVIPFDLIGNSSDSGYTPLPYVEKKGGIFTTDPQANTYQYYTVDNNNLYFNVLAINTGGFFSTLHFSAGFYIFNIPALSVLSS